MFKDEIHAVATSAAAKFALLKKNPLGYLISSALAGAFIGFGVLLAFTAGGLLSAAASPLVKIVMGLSFGIALSLVVMAGAELFTGNNFVMAVGIAKKTVRLRDALLLWAVCWLGNLIGAVLLAFLFHGTGLNSGAVGEFIAASALTKTTLPALNLILRGLFCNILVCLGVWCSAKMKSESGKLIMIFWCLFAFITIGFEHSIANMSLIVIGLLGDGIAGLTIGGYFRNLLFVTIGNMIGGIVCVALPYLQIAKEK
ncbi:MAG: formate/nitrite transporter family protein [Christensenellaceae bacterium]|nr:formate/nitrite transporter family protein [Christensenellaceae bacterium]